MLPQEVQAVLSRLESAGFTAYLVGGCVRDLLMERTPQDWDMTASARPEQVMALFAGRCIPTGLPHGTVTVQEGSCAFELTTFRADGAYADHRHPDAVRFSDTLAEDLRRRDFTVNAMAMDLRGELTDLHGGREDIRNRVIRCVGVPERRFDEDALRIMRALRFAATLGFAIEPETARSLRARRELLRGIAAERLYAEMSRLLCGDGAAQVLLDFPEVIGVFLPEILPCVGFDQRNCHHCYDVWEHTVRAVAAAPQDATLRWTLLLHDLGKPETFTLDDGGVGHFCGHGKVSVMLADAAMERLRFPTAQRREILRLIDWHDRDIPRTEKSIRRALNKLGAEGLRQLIAVKRADNMAQAAAFRGAQRELDKTEEIMASLLRQDACFSLKQLAIRGEDVLALGQRGAAVGAALQRALEAVMDGAVPNEREALTDWLRERL